MPYANISDLPKNVRDSLPEHAQTIYMKAYNSAAEANPDYDEERLAKIAWGAVKKTYHKNDTGEWVRAEIMGEDVPASNYDAKTHIVKAIKVGTVGHSPSGAPFECTAEWLAAHAQDWEGGRLIVNHYGHNSEPHADIEKSWFDGEFEMMQLANMNPETERRMLGNDHTGFSFDAIGDPNDPANAFGTNLSILFYPHSPACSTSDGCGLMADVVVKTDDGKEYPASCYLYVPDAKAPSTWKLRVCEYANDSRDITRAQLGRAAAALSPGGFRGNRVQLPSVEVSRVKTKLRSLYHKIGVKTEDIPQNIKGSEAMAEDKTYTTAEIESMKAEASEVAASLATFKAEAKTHDSTVAALKAEIDARNDKISELTEKADTLFAAETVEAKVEEAKATMFSAEDVETAKKEAVETAIAAEAERVDKIAAELAAITKMFPEGLDDTFRDSIVAMVKEGKSHEALVELGKIEYTSFKANVSTGTGGSTETEEIVAEGGAGVYDPVTGSFKKAGE